MMRTISYGLITGIGLLFFSCDTENANESLDANVVHEGHEHTSESIELDNGEKWIVVDEMMQHIRAMENDVKQAKNEEQIDYCALATKLMDNINLLTSNCTMTGKAHDELHKWLLPYIDLVSELSKAKNHEEQVQAYEAIQISFKTFNTYFK